MSVLEKIFAFIEQGIKTFVLRKIAKKPELTTQNKELAGMFLAPSTRMTSPDRFSILIRDMERLRHTLMANLTFGYASKATTQKAKAHYEREALVYTLKAKATHTRNLTQDFTDMAAVEDSYGNTPENLAVASGNEDMLRIIKAARVIRAIQMLPDPQPK